MELAQDHTAHKSGLLDSNLPIWLEPMVLLYPSNIISRR